jgi:hypothetical protein
MSETATGLVVRQRSFSLMPTTLGEAREIANMIAGSDFAPKDYRGKPDNVIIAIQMGADLGLKPLQALQNIAIINGRPSIYGDAALALVQASGQIERFHEEFTGTFPNDDFTAHCTIKRKGWPDEIKSSFSVADAKAAKLWGKRGRDGQDTPWITYPQRMLKFRARGFAVRDAGSDLLLGLVLAEEAQDYPSIEGHVVSVEDVPAKATTAFDRLPESLQENIEKAFAALNMGAGARLAKLNEWLGGDGVDIEAQATGLLEWCRDEFAKRKTGKPRGKKADNGKKSEPQAGGDSAGAVAPTTGGGAAAAGHGEGAGARAGVTDRPADAGPDAGPMETATGSGSPAVAQGIGDLF